ncbi:MAG: ribosome biogenesis GTPase Der [Desulfofustis sp.]|nr:ribosome biogenesis GTPase Der [Desulfofustis sp.]
MHNRTTAIVALVGRPNVGKSTLFNRITRSRKAIVDPTPGVTRDRQYERVSWKDHFFMLVDTGGIDDNPEDAMVEDIRTQAMTAIEEADIILFIMDGKEGLMPADHEVINLLRRVEKRIFYVVNKIDGPEQEDELLIPFYELGVDQLWSVSAEHSYGFGTLMDGLCEALPDDSASQEIPENTIRLAFLGRPNVGKSSMINRIVGEQRMVVSDIPGTTRDSVDTLLSHKDKNYLLIDTAGIRRKGKTREKLEKFSILKALAALGRCDIAVVLLDAEEGITEQDAKVIGYTQEQGRGLILLVNKWDLVADDKKRQVQIMEEIALAVPFVGFAPLIRVSALTGYGFKRLFPAVGSVYRQFTATFPTSALNRLLADATEHHSPPIYKNKRLKLYYTSQISTAPPTFVIMTNSYKGVHFSYQRYLVNRYRDGLDLDRVPLRLLFKDKKQQRSRRA